MSPIVGIGRLARVVHLKTRAKAFQNLIVWKVAGAKETVKFGAGPFPGLG
jgi:hypothetical protein